MEPTGKIEFFPTADDHAVKCVEKQASELLNGGRAGFWTEQADILIEEILIALNLHGIREVTRQEVLCQLEKSNAALALLLRQRKAAVALYTSSSQLFSNIKAVAVQTLKAEIDAVEEQRLRAIIAAYDAARAAGEIE